MPISTLMTILWGDVIHCFLKENFLYYYKNYETSKCHNLLNFYSFLLIFGTIIVLYKRNHFVPSLLFLCAEFFLTLAFFLQDQQKLPIFCMYGRICYFFLFWSFFNSFWVSGITNNIFIIEIINLQPKLLAFCWHKHLFLE